MSTPLPSLLTTLDSLATLSPGTKVRFLGCVTSYDVPTVTLTLSLPPSVSNEAVDRATSSAANKRARARRGAASIRIEGDVGTRALVAVAVDVSLLTPGLRREATDRGAWVSVLGYIARNDGPNESTLSTGRQAAAKDGRSSAARAGVRVQALLVQVEKGVAEIGLQRFEEAVRARTAAMQSMQAAREKTRIDAWREEEEEEEEEEEGRRRRRI
ncbi:hypothetical protein MRB53_037889 [Persea americana]|nr:hypothetical protein MRB53_037889 [Persea americana]